MKRVLIVSWVVLVASAAQAGTITDDFNRPDAFGSGVGTLTAIGNGWPGEGARRWDISGNELMANTGAGNEIYQTTPGAETLNSAVGSGFTEIGFVAINNASGAAWGGLIVNADSLAGTAITFRMSGTGAVQLLRPNGTTIVNDGGAISGFVSTRSYRMTISSDSSNVYGLEIYDPVNAAVVYTNNNVVNGGGSAASDGLGGFYANTANITYDNFSLTTIPEPSTALLVLGGLGILLTVRQRRKTGF